MACHTNYHREGRHQDPALVVHLQFTTSINIQRSQGIDFSYSQQQDVQECLDKWNDSDADIDEGLDDNDDEEIESNSINIVVDDIVL
ncbi:hypothetical protein VE02_08446 [Pseudogymnoascus sp. 03VT05]|nr:hypothetical protein VE02_08446 [Pseudogymnoascus sp. 03VT05]